MHILHINNGFCNSKVHSNLCQQLDSKIERQTIYTYIANRNKVGSNKFDGKSTEIIYDCILNSFIRKIYFLRIWWTYRHLVKKVNPRGIDAIFATTLFSDGGVAYKLYKQYEIPYIVAVRATDLSLYLEHSKLLWKYGREVLLNAKQIILINKIFWEKLRTHPFSKKIWDDIKDKIIIRPNGIDSFWVNHVNRDERVNRYSICYVGSFIPRKNVPILIKAVQTLEADYPDIQLHIVGEGGTDENEVKKLAEKDPHITFIGPIRDKDRLIDIYRQNGIFAMPSLYETFGLVYTEALTQNLRLLYTKGTGIDGLFENVGVAVESPTVENVANGLNKILTNYEQMNGSSHVDFAYYNWSFIADEYVSIFNKILNTK